MLAKAPPRKRQQRRAAWLAPTLLALLLACLALSACGSSSKPKRSSAGTSGAGATDVARTSTIPSPSTVAPSKVVARVGEKAIRFATIAHLMKIKSAQTPLPDPPSYAKCIAGIRAKGTGAAAKQPEAQIKRLCQKGYEAALQSAVSTAIHNQWLLGAGAELGVSVSPAEVQREFDLSKKSFKSDAEFETYRKSTGESLADMRLQLKLGKLIDKVFQKLKRKEHPATSAQVAAYYAAHRSQYAIPEGREVRILRTTTKAAAISAKQELQSGKSFAALVKQFSTVGQPLTAKHGEIADLKPTLFGEKTLNQAIFSAPLNRLSGPVRVIATHKDIPAESGSGYYLFEVTRIVPGSQTPLGAVRNSIAEELTKAQKEHTITSFVLAFRRKWRAKSDCEPGYIAPNCRQYKVPKGVREDLFTL
jgi:foldase protein PrsA